MVPPFLALNQYPSLTEACVRDLAWALCSKNKLPADVENFERAELFSDEQGTANWLLQLNSNPQPLKDYLAHNNTQRLGKYFESLLAFFLEYSPTSHYRIESQSYVIRGTTNQSKSTLGELDFILRQDQQLMHLEVAVKFYLGIDIDGKKHWLGPNAKDSLERKINHLQNHQLPMGRHYPETTETKHYLQGYLFEHATHSRNGLPRKGSPLCSWCYRHELKDWLLQQPMDWQVLSRKQWLGALHEYEFGQKNQNLNNELLQLVENEDLDKAKMLSGIIRNVAEPENMSRLMVVPDTWPQV